MQVALRSWHLGIDLGQRRSHTALVLLEQRVTATGYTCPIDYEREYTTTLHLRWIERLALGTSYSNLARDLARLTRSDLFPRDEKLTIAVDATGVGTAVTEMIENAKPRGELMRCLITDGNNPTIDRGWHHVPRSHLLLGVQSTFEQNEISVAEGVHGWEALAEELRGMRKIANSHGFRFETESQNDDLVFALALGLYGARHRRLPTRNLRPVL